MIGRSHVHNTTIRFSRTDAAGVIYFAQVLDLAHEAYESMMEEAGCPLSTFLKPNSIHLPIIRSEADFRLPMRSGDRIRVELAVSHIGARSFATTSRVLLEPDRTVAAQVTLYHCCVYPDGSGATDIPDWLRSALA
ncbi:MAG: thioesterase family protein [Planctomycetota bacterium]|nr:thioesterase family protein [Planctomycetota bacterium]MDA1106240.1 thioesterase family protein [Planctomycetota bacterium]